MNIPLERITYLDLGCGPDGGRISSLLESGVKTVYGVDLDPTFGNLDTLVTEAWLRIQDVTDPTSIFTDTSVYSYPDCFWQKDGGPTILTALNLLKTKLEACVARQEQGNKKADSEALVGIKETTKSSQELLAKRFAAQPFVVQEAVRKRIVQADVLDFLPTLPDGQLERVYADYFFNNIGPKKTAEVARLVARKLSPEGVLEVVGDHLFISNELASDLANNGLELKEHSMHLRDDELAGLSPRTRAVISMRKGIGEHCMVGHGMEFIRADGL